MYAQPRRLDASDTDPGPESTSWCAHRSARWLDGRDQDRHRGWRGWLNHRLGRLRLRRRSGRLNSRLRIRCGCGPTGGDWERCRRRAFRRHGSWFGCWDGLAGRAHRELPAVAAELASVVTRLDAQLVQAECEAPHHIDDLDSNGRTAQVNRDRLAVDVDDDVCKVAGRAHPRANRDLAGRQRGPWRRLKAADDREGARGTSGIRHNPRRR